MIIGNQKMFPKKEPWNTQLKGITTIYIYCAY